MKLIAKIVAAVLGAVYAALLAGAPALAQKIFRAAVGRFCWEIRLDEVSGGTHHAFAHFLSTIEPVRKRSRKFHVIFRGGPSGVKQASEVGSESPPVAGFAVPFDEYGQPLDGWTEEDERQFLEECPDFYEHDDDGPPNPTTTASYRLALPEIVGLRAEPILDDLSFHRHGARFWTKIEYHAGEKTTERTGFLVIRCIGPESAWKKLLAEYEEHVKAQEKGTCAIFLNQGAAWKRVQAIATRDISSVLLPDGQERDVLRRCHEFFLAAPRYAALGIPHRLGFMLHGDPGTGKTALAQAVAGALGVNIYCLNLQDSALADSDLANLMQALDARCVLLIEDADAAPVCRARQPEPEETTEGLPKMIRRKLTLQGVLNVLDGPLAPANRVLFITTNHPEHLDAALVRPGRVDVRIHFGPATYQQAARRFEQFHPTAPGELANRFAAGCVGRGYVMAQVQEALVRYMDDPAEAVAFVEVGEV